MQPCRLTSRTVPRVCKATCASPSRTMFTTTTPFFPHFGGGSTISPLTVFSNDVFRLLDSATADIIPHSSRHAVARSRSYNPRFDVREVGQEYQLQGELPGIEQKDLSIEFVDERTLVIRGRSVREAETRTRTNEAGGEVLAQKAVAAEEASGDDASEKSAANYRKASVEDEDYVDAGAESSEKGATLENAEVAETETKTKLAEVEPDSDRYWVSERAVGEFERRFSFPGQVNQEEVRASLRNGILSVVVPKMVAKGARKIEIQ